MPDFRLTPKQEEANEVLASNARHIMLFGGSRSGKTFLAVRALVVRSLKAPKSRHAILRFRFNAVKASIAYDTFPKVMELCWPAVKYELNKTDWFFELANGSQLWLGGLDDKERTEKILGNEYASIFLNECSQIPWSSRNIAVTRLAQVAPTVNGQQLLPRMMYDENPPDKGHWSYRVFVQKQDPETKQPLPDPQNYAAIQLNPGDNADNLPPEYLGTLQGLSARLQRRFLFGEFRDANPLALFSEEAFDKWRVLDGSLPDFQRIVVAVDPSGSGDKDNAENDAIGVVVAALGTDGNGYLLEDLTLKAGPATWGRVVTTAFERHQADVVVGEINYGGAMVGEVIKTARRGTPFKEVRATRGKVVRAEPFSPLFEDGRVRIVGHMRELEDELCAMTTNGFIGENSPNRADAAIWALTELFPGMVNTRSKMQPLRYSNLGIV
jgi:predicted phage terminase large subunit-like protein